tara:strand:- start:64 stop:432 length:369 start_codon:yes stop_codon:yes gene_type:complete
MPRQEKLAHDMALLDEADNDMCVIPLEKLRSKVMRDRHKKLCVIPKNVNTKSIWSKAARVGITGKLYNSIDAPHYTWKIEEGPADNLVVLIRDITSQMIGAIKKNDQKKLIGLYKNLGKVIK